MFTLVTFTPSCCFKNLFLQAIKMIKPVHPKGNQPWIFIGRTDGWSWNANTLTTWCKELTHWKRLWYWQRLKAEGDRDNRGWDGWMASLTRWTWVWANSRSWWWTGDPDVLVHGVAKSQMQLSSWTELNCFSKIWKLWRWAVVSSCSPENE